MKKVKLCLITLLLCIACAGLALVACNKDSYVPHYQTEECSLKVSEFNNSPNTVTYGKSFTVNETMLYFDNDLKNGKIIDGWIDRVKKYNEILNQKEFNTVKNIYISDKVIDNFNTDSEISVSFKPETCEEEAFGWILRAVSENDLPYGIYAGLAASLLEKEEYSDFVHSGIATAGYLTELQFPIYEAGNLPDGERAYAWSFSNYIVKELISSGKSETEIAAMTADEFNSYLLDKYKVILPDYSFSPYSTKYEYKVEQDCFTYFINKEFNDFILPESCFTTSYNHLSDWFNDNSKTSKESNSAFGIGSMYDITVYLDDGLKSLGTSGEAGKDYIIIYSAGAFSHEYIHHILYKNGKSSYLREFFTEYQANGSKYSMAMYYYLLSGSSEYYPYSESLNEKQSYTETIELYNKLSPSKAAPDNFNYWLFCDCFSALYTETGKKFISRAQDNSWLYYLAREYGSEYLWLLNANNTHSIGGKTVNEVIEEWIGYLKTLKS